MFVLKQGYSLTREPLGFIFTLLQHHLAYIDICTAPKRYSIGLSTNFQPFFSCCVVCSYLCLVILLKVEHGSSTGGTFILCFNKLPALIFVALHRLYITLWLWLYSERKHGATTTLQPIGECCRLVLHISKGRTIQPGVVARKVVEGTVIHCFGLSAPRRGLRSVIMGVNPWLRWPWSYLRWMAGDVCDMSWN